MIEWIELEDIIQKYFLKKGKIIYIFSPFINIEKMKLILANKICEPVVIITSWRKDHLLTGVSSLDLYLLTKDMGWTLYINDRLHIKLYSDSLKSAWIGSANITNNGLNGGNIEGLTFIESLDTNDKIEIQKIISQSKLVDDNIYALYKEWIEKQEIINLPPPKSLDVSDEARITEFLTNQLPASISPSRMWTVANEPGVEIGDWGEQEAMEHDVAIYSVSPWKEKTEFIAELKVRFFSHPFISALDKTITQKGVQFGRIKEWIQKNCTDVPVPYRKELTPHVQHIMKWFIELAPDKYEIIRPYYSEIIRKKV